MENAKMFNADNLAKQIDYFDSYLLYLTQVGISEVNDKLMSKLNNIFSQLSQVVSYWEVRNKNGYFEHRIDKSLWGDRYLLQYAFEDFIIHRSNVNGEKDSLFCLLCDEYIGNTHSSLVEHLTISSHLQRALDMKSREELWGPKSYNMFRLLFDKFIDIRCDNTLFCKICGIVLPKATVNLLTHVQGKFHLNKFTKIINMDLFFRKSPVDIHKDVPRDLSTTIALEIQEEISNTNAKEKDSCDIVSQKEAVKISQEPTSLQSGDKEVSTHKKTKTIMNIINELSENLSNAAVDKECQVVEPLKEKMLKSGPIFEPNEVKVKNNRPIHPFGNANIMSSANRAPEQISNKMNRNTVKPFKMKLPKADFSSTSKKHSKDACLNLHDAFMVEVVKHVDSVKFFCQACCSFEVCVSFEAIDVHVTSPKHKHFVQLKMGLASLKLEWSYCKTCNANFFCDENLMKTHLQCRKHLSLTMELDKSEKCSSKNDNEPNSNIKSEKKVNVSELTACLNGRLKNALKEIANSKNNKSISFYCNSCNYFVCNDNKWNKHLKSYSHSQNNEFTPGAKVHMCKCMTTVFCNFDFFQAHINTKVHHTMFDHVRARENEKQSSASSSVGKLNSNAPSLPNASCVRTENILVGILDSSQSNLSRSLQILDKNLTKSLSLTNEEDSTFYCQPCENFVCKFINWKSHKQTESHLRSMQQFPECKQFVCSCGILLICSAALFNEHIQTVIHGKVQNLFEMRNNSQSFQQSRVKEVKLENETGYLQRKFKRIPPRFQSSYGDFIGDTEVAAQKQNVTPEYSVGSSLKSRGSQKKDTRSSEAPKDEILDILCHQYASISVPSTSNVSPKQHTGSTDDVEAELPKVEIKEEKIYERKIAQNGEVVNAVADWKKQESDVKMPICKLPDHVENAMSNDLEGMVVKLVKEANDIYGAMITEADNAVLVTEQIENDVKAAFSRCKNVITIGSRVLGLAHQNSAIDLFVEIDDNYYDKLLDVKDPTMVARLQEIETALKSSNPPKFSNVEIKDNTVVASHDLSKLKCRILCENGFVVENCLLLKAYLAIDPRIRELVLLVKTWANCTNFSQYVSGDTINWMVLQFLMFSNVIHPPVVLNGHFKESPIPGWSMGTLIGKSSTSISAVLKKSRPDALEKLAGAFFKYYAHENYANVFILLTNEQISKSSFSSCKYPSSSKYGMFVKQTDLFLRDFDVNDCFCLQSPFELHRNLATSFDKYVLKEFSSSCDKMIYVLSYFPDWD